MRQHCVNNRHLPYVLAVELREMGELIGDAGVNRVEGNSDEVEMHILTIGIFNEFLKK